MPSAERWISKPLSLAELSSQVRNTSSATLLALRLLGETGVGRVGAITVPNVALLARLDQTDPPTALNALMRYVWMPLPLLSWT